MRVNKVVYNGNTLIDLTADTITADKLLVGTTAHDANGKFIKGASRPALLVPEHYDYNIGYVDNGTWKYENPTNTYTDIYKVYANHLYFISLGDTVGTRFRSMFTTTDITTISSGNVAGTAIINKNNPVAYEYATPYKATKDGYILVAKDNIGHSGLFSYVCDMTYYLFGFTTSYLEFSSDANFTLSVNEPNWNGTMEYSTDASTWSTWDGSQLSGTATQSIYIRGTGNTIITDGEGEDNTYSWSFTGKYIYGNIESLLDYQTVANGQHPTMGDYCYGCMFFGCSSLITAPELPATTLSDWCYADMFERCYALINIPKLPATTLAEGCYYSMFYNCESLVNIPELPATILAAECYEYMFGGCRSLVNAPDLPVTTLANQCYEGMFYNCISLVDAPELPATILTVGCYNDMFSSCIKLVTAPELPATTLAENCYKYMFEDCVSLINSPVLPATTLARNCYECMFKGCVLLDKLPILSAVTLMADCYNSMFEGCLNIKLSTSQIDEYQYAFRIPTNDTGVDASGALLSMFDNTGGTFTGDPEINTTYYTNNKPLNYSYLIFESDEPFMLSVLSPGWDGVIEYSLDNGLTWTTWDGSELSGTASQPIYLRGINNTTITNWHVSHKWSFTGKYIIGNIENLLNYQIVANNQHPIMANGCYSCMFAGCESLITAPELPATVLTEECYSSMFNGCTSLVTAPVLPATILAESCYNDMFDGCTALINLPELPATTLADWCYAFMFDSCTSLITIPNLPATILTDYCYHYMFSACTSLEISATQTDEYQYAFQIPTNGVGVNNADNALSYMFNNTGGTFTGNPNINTTYYVKHQPI